MLIVCPSCASEYTIEAGRLGPQGRRVRCAACRESWHVEAPAAAAPEAVGAEGVEPAEVAEVAAAPMVALEPPPVLAAVVLEPEAEPEPVVDAAVAASLSEPVDARLDPAPLAVGEVEVPSAEAPAGPVPSDAPAEPVTIESRDHAPATAEPKQPHGKSRTLRKAGRTGGAKRAPSAVSPRRAGLASIGAALAAGLACAAVLAGRNAVVSAVPESAVVFERLGLPVNIVGLTFAEVASSMTPSVPGGGGPGVLLVEGRIENPTRREIDVPDIDIAVRGEGGELLYNWSVPAASTKLAGGDGTTFRARLSSPPPAGQRVQVTFRVEGRDVKVALR